MLGCHDFAGEILESYFFPGDSQSSLVILSGPRAAGKTNRCLQLFALATQKDIETRGLISKPVYDGDEKIAIELIDLSTGEQRRLAEIRQAGGRESLTPGWKFDSQSLQWGNFILARIEQTQLLIIDELGPLEFLGHEGWQAAFPLIANCAYGCAVVVIRLSLLGLAKERWPWAEVIEIGGDDHD